MRYLCLSLTIRTGNFPTFLKSFRSVLERGPSARSFRSWSFSWIVPFSFCSFTNRSNNFKNAFYAFVLFSEWWDRSWSFRLFSSKNNCSPGTTISPRPCHLYKLLNRQTTKQLFFLHLLAILIFFLLVKFYFKETWT